MSCRFLLPILVFFIGLALCPSAFGYDWKQYREHFVSVDGRIIDYYQNRISHSEGQGYGLLLALCNNDRESFERIWRWTHDNLQMRKGDKLFCWSWGRRPNGKWQVIDYNDAADGDVLIGWALLLGWKKWHEPYFNKAAKEIAASIRSRLSLQIDAFKVVLPGYYGFFHDHLLVINPSYFILRAFQDFSQIDAPVFWKEVMDSSKKILRQVRFGAWSLPPDWAAQEKGASSFKPFNKGPCFSFDAYRLFLYSSWINAPFLRQGFDKLAHFFEQNGYLPALVNLKKDCVSIKDGSAGMYASLAAYGFAIGRQKVAKRLMQIADKKIENEKNDYFSASLYLLSKARLVQ